VMAKRFETEVVGPLRSEHASLEDLATLFKAYDKNDDGYMSADDVHHVLTLLGSSVTKSLVQNEWASVVDENGLVSFAQFVKHVRDIESQKRKDDGVSSVSSVLKLRDKRDLLRSRR
jgi:Ca2+-binding EF-hand superfamily protein